MLPISHANQNVPLLLRRFNQTNWGGVNDFLYHQGGEGIAVSVGPDSDAHAYQLDGATGAFGPVVVSVDTPYIGAVGDNLAIRPYPPITAGSEFAPYLYRADVLVWKVCPPFFPLKRRTRYWTKAPTTDTFLTYAMVQGRKIVRVFVDNSVTLTGSQTIKIFAAKSDLGSYSDGGVATPLLVTSQLPNASGSFVVAPGSTSYIELDVANYGVSGADWIYVSSATDTSGQLARSIRIEAHD